VVDYSSGLGAGFIDRKFYLRSWQDPAIDVANLYLAPGVRPALVAQAVRARLGGGAGLFVTETGTLREEFVRIADESFSYTRALELIMLVIAITGVVGTMVAAVLDRTREIGLLRAMGATRLQIAVAVLVEAGFLGLCAACAGVVAGSVHCALLLHTVVARSSGWHLDFVFPTASVLRVSALVIAAAAAAGLAPAVRAARLDVKDALVGE
jgi:putative ABC transport system permease protein